MLSIDEIAAAANEYLRIPDDNVDMPDRVLWWTLRSLYEDFRRGVLSKEAAQKMKQDAVMQHTRDRAQYAGARELVQHQAEMWMRVENAARDYAKGNGRTPEGDALFEAMYGKTLKEVNYEREHST